MSNRQNIISLEIKIQIKEKYFFSFNRSKSKMNYGKEIFINYLFFYFNNFILIILFNIFLVQANQNQAGTAQLVPVQLAEFPPAVNQNFFLVQNPTQVNVNFKTLYVKKTHPFCHDVSTKINFLGLV